MKRTHSGDKCCNGASRLATPVAPVARDRGQQCQHSMGPDGFASETGMHMRFRWIHTRSMATMIQVRNVPEEVHRKLKARAALAGMSLSAYALKELQSGLERPTADELMKRLRSRERVSVHPRPADLIREQRERQ